jgi:enoyl-CoA hydratase/carnithine racemase
VDSEDALTATTRDLAGTIASLAPLAIATIKAEITAIGECADDTNLRGVAEARRRSAWASEDYREGIAAFAERRTPKFRGQ